MELTEEREVASKNFEKIVSFMPSALRKKEDGIAIRLQKSKANSLKKLQLLYDFMDEIYSFSSKYTACKKGCSYCCSYAVTISETEILHIEKHQKIKRNRTYLKHREFHGEKCIFLKDEKCSIYSSRPFVCRRHVALTKTNYWCKPDLSKDEEFPLLNYTGIDAAYDFIQRDSQSDGVVDIRQAFGSE